MRPLTSYKAPKQKCTTLLVLETDNYLCWTVRYSFPPIKRASREITTLCFLCRKQRRVLWLCPHKMIAHFMSGYFDLTYIYSYSHFINWVHIHIKWVMCSCYMPHSNVWDSINEHIWSQSCFAIFVSTWTGNVNICIFRRFTSYIMLLAKGPLISH